MPHPWGVGEWGIDGWGVAGGEPTAPPTILAVITPHGARSTGGNVVARRGGDVIEIIGTNFADPMTIEVLSGGNVLGTCYIWDVEFDLQPDRVWCGTPALADGTYDLRVTTVVAAVTMLNALKYELFSEEMKAQMVRSKHNIKWKTGRRLLTTGEAL